MVVQQQLEHLLPDEEEPQPILEDSVEEAISVKVKEAIAVKVEEATLVKEQTIDNISPEISQDTLHQDASQINTNSAESTEMTMPQLPPMTPSATIHQGSVCLGQQQVCSQKGRSFLILEDPSVLVVTLSCWASCMAKPWQASNCLSCRPQNRLWH
jgi:hypothetical protein